MRLDHVAARQERQRGKRYFGDIRARIDAARLHRFHFGADPVDRRSVHASHAEHDDGHPAIARADARGYAQGCAAIEDGLCVAGVAVDGEVEQMEFERAALRFVRAFFVSQRFLFLIGEIGLRDVVDVAARRDVSVAQPARL
jgi:GMP synthase-like glutamine amidotransferase